MSDHSPEVKKPVLLVIASTYPRWMGDPEPGFVHELSRRLMGHFDVVVLTPSAPGTLDCEIMDGVRVVRYRYAPRKLQTLIYNGGIVANLRRSRWKVGLLPGYLLAQWFVAQRLLLSERVDVIHAHWVIPQGLLAAPLGKPLLVTCHGADVFALRGRFFDWLRRLVLNRAAGTTVVSRDMRAELLRQSPGSVPANVVPMGIDTERFTSIASEGRERMPARLLFVGRLVTKKGLTYLLRALPEVRRAIPSVELAIAGFGPERGRLEEQCKSLGIQGYVTFLGPVEQSALPALYQSATIFVAPFIQADDGDREGLGLVVAEAMACGCPVIAGNVGGVLDLVDGNRGLVVDAKKTPLLSSAIITLLSDSVRRQAMSENSTAFVRENFSWESSASRYREILLDMAPHGRT